MKAIVLRAELVGQLVIKIKIYLMDLLLLGLKELPTDEVPLGHMYFSHSPRQSDAKIS